MHVYRTENPGAFKNVAKVSLPVVWMPIFSITFVLELEKYLMWGNLPFHIMLWMNNAMFLELYRYPSVIVCFKRNVLPAGDFHIPCDGESRVMREMWKDFMNRRHFRTLMLSALRLQILSRVVCGNCLCLVCQQLAEI